LRRVEIESGLRGFLHAPDGEGPFPALVWNHGSERDPGPRGELGDFYASHGYALLVAHRRGHGESDGEYPLDRLRSQVDASTVVEAVLELHERYLGDTLAAARWLAAQPEVDAERLAMSGVSHGAIQALLAAEAGSGMRAYVAFAPGAMAWEGSPALHERLVRAVRAARAPIFLLQAENDFSLGPSEVLGAELRDKGEPNRAYLYPPYGDTRAAGHGDFACLGSSVWGPDVLAFLEETLGQRRRSNSSGRASSEASR
jgi:carboxymethylenebutenolidase